MVLARGNAVSNGQSTHLIWAARAARWQKLRWKRAQAAPGSDPLPCASGVLAPIPQGETQSRYWFECTCGARFHVRCLAAAFENKVGLQDPSGAAVAGSGLMPQSGRCPTCHKLYTWGQVVRNITDKLNEDAAVLVAADAAARASQKRAPSKSRVGASKKSRKVPGADTDSAEVQDDDDDSDEDVGSRACGGASGAAANAKAQSSGMRAEGGEGEEGERESVLSDSEEGGLSEAWDDEEGWGWTIDEGGWDGEDDGYAWAHELDDGDSPQHPDSPSAKTAEPSPRHESGIGSHGSALLAAGCADYAREGPHHESPAGTEAASGDDVVDLT